MLCDPAPFGRGSERLSMWQGAGGLGSIPVSAGDFHVQWSISGA